MWICPVHAAANRVLFSGILDICDVCGRLRNIGSRTFGRSCSNSVLLARQEVFYTELLAVCVGNSIPSWNIGFVADVVLCQPLIEESGS